MFLTEDLAESFMIKGVLKMPFKLFGQEVWLTDASLSLMIIVVALIVIAFVVKHIFAHAKMIPTGVQNAIELIVEKIDSIPQSNFGPNAYRFANYFGTVFLLLLFCNLGGLIGLRAPTGDFGVTLPLGLITFAIIQFQGFKNSGIGHITGLFKPVPLLFPINLIGEIANPFTLALRLFANMLSGIIILGLWYGMIPLLGRLVIPSFLHVYCDLFSGCIQAYVFCMLSQVYINQKIEG